MEKTQERAEQHTAPQVNERIEQECRERVQRLASAPPGEIQARLEELDREWDIERTLQANMGVVMLSSVALGWAHDRRWWYLSAAAGAFFLQHALQGWCPPLIPWRRAGVRTAKEIEEERAALLDLLGEDPGLEPHADRVRKATADRVNQRIQHRTQQNAAGAAGLGPNAVQHRLRAIDREWDTERVIEAEGASMALLGCALAAAVHPGFMAIPAVVGAAMLGHAVHGWYPLLPVFRRMGFRSSGEVLAERTALRRSMT